MTTYPYGYARPANGGPQGMGTMLTWEQMMTKSTVKYLHPEVQRRLHALIDFAASVGVALGVGTGWRVQPNPPPPGFAKPGNSWHESTPVSPTSSTAMAIDTVPNVSWDWMEQHCGKFGFRTFRNVNREPWHIQPIEISAARKYATVCPPLTTWNLPGSTPPPTPSTPSKPIPGGPDVPQPLSPPVRNSDTRGFGGAGLKAGVANKFGLNASVFPANTIMVAFNVTVIPTTANGGYFAVWPNGTVKPNTSCINFPANPNFKTTGGIPANGAIVVGIDKLTWMMQLQGSSAHVIFDATAYWTTAPDVTRT